ncbi:ArsR family transcriptional regulator [Chryseobacterium formosense]|uniref:ArsR family transcriptional regulator n=1 Tax=Chryseobacterium formosense TaxID=236814 RepID=A0A085Z839_9FLAO|nr:metalloregulator ArsR/SmtB family transcription factor [Chryseobacterium formosense]KFF00603.1 ArsR family transcriptional regulator [Chryseobacterium formosense]SFT35555.1 transcriptional regulator, ArsR family [Chryseobacterium formosense]
MKLLEVIKSLSNETRLNILGWLKDPFDHFPEEELSNYSPELGICVSDIAQKAAMSVPTVSDYLKTMSNAEILIGTRKGQWTYYKRNEKAIQELARMIKEDL